MRETDPRPAETTLHVCLDCGTGVHTTGETNDCPDCGGRLRNTTVPHD